MPAGQQCVLVALTGWGQEEDRQRTREAGFKHHLVKPVDLQALKELLVELRDDVVRADIKADTEAGASV
jgi:CheY-like chemotaxis protein